MKYRCVVNFGTLSRYILDYQGGIQVFFAWHTNSPSRVKKRRAKVGKMVKKRGKWMKRVIFQIFDLFYNE